LRRAVSWKKSIQSHFRDGALGVAALQKMFNTVGIHRGVLLSESGWKYNFHKRIKGKEGASTKWVQRVLGQWSDVQRELAKSDTGIPACERSFCNKVQRHRLSAAVMDAKEQGHFTDRNVCVTFKFTHFGVATV
jgi:hypothetical protein